MTETKRYTMLSTLRRQDEEVLLRLAMGRSKRYTRRNSFEYDSPSEGEAPYKTDEDEDRACRIPAKTDKPQIRKTNKTDQKYSKLTDLIVI